MKLIITSIAFSLLTATFALAQTAPAEEKIQDTETQSVLSEPAAGTELVTTARTQPAKFKKLPLATEAALNREFPGCLILSSEVFDSNDRSGSGSASYGIKILYGDERYSVEISPEGKMISRLRQYTNY